MSRERDTDTLTRIDLGPDQPTVKNSTGDEAETHKLDPRNYAPLRVCPECSLAWEITGEWCPSCGTAFDKSARESARATRVMPARPVSPARTGNQRPLTRSARRRGTTPPPPAAKAAAPARSGGAGKVVFTVLVFAAAITVAFFVGQSTRPSQAQVDNSITNAVNSAKRSAAESYSRAFDTLQARAAEAVKQARKKALAEGEANAQQQQLTDQASNQSFFDGVTACVIHGEC
jgi:hypothetical protein